MPRTTLDLDSTVLDELRRRATREHKSLGQIASELLAQQLVDERGASQAEPFVWITGHLGTPRVDLEDKDAIAALLDQPL